jgi:hypothetical protein
MVVFFLLWILYCISEGFDHAWYRTINHNRATLRRIATGLVVVYALCGAGTSWVLYLNTSLLLAFSFTVFFDISRNLSTANDWHYIGSTSTLDKIFRRSKWATWSVKFVLLTASAIAQYYCSSYIVMASPLINTTWLF